MPTPKKTVEVVTTQKPKKLRVICVENPNDYLEASLREHNIELEFRNEYADSQYIYLNRIKAKVLGERLVAMSEHLPNISEDITEREVI